MDKKWTAFSTNAGALGRQFSRYYAACPVRPRTNRQQSGSRHRLTIFEPVHFLSTKKAYLCKIIFGEHARNYLMRYQFSDNKLTN